MNEDSTATLRGMGPVYGLLREGCPACHLKRDAQSVEPVAAFAFGLALTFVRGGALVRSALCPAHASLVALLATELRTAAAEEP